MEGLAGKPKSEQPYEDEDTQPYGEPANGEEEFKEKTKPASKAPAKPHMRKPAAAKTVVAKERAVKNNLVRTERHKDWTVEWFERSGKTKGQYSKYTSPSGDVFWSKTAAEKNGFIEVEV